MSSLQTPWQFFAQCSKVRLGDTIDRVLVGRLLNGQLPFARATN